ncbi:Hypothetical protein, putative, partial [Bodo saltans]
MEELKKALMLAKKDCDSARLDLVATRENRVFYSAKVTAMTNANEAFDEACKHEVEVLKQAVKQVKRTGKDKGYEVNYVREVASGVEREMELVQTTIAQVETDVRTDPRELERELDRLAFVVGGLMADRPRLQRTAAALHAAKERMDQVAPRRIMNAAPSHQQLTIIGGSSGISASTPTVRSAYACGEVLQRVEDALTLRCGFDVVERIVPGIGSWAPVKGSSATIEAALHRRVVLALTQAATIPQGLDDAEVPTQSLIVIHCPSITRRVAMADGSAGPQTEIVLMISQIPDDAKAFLASTSAGAGIAWDDVGATTIPLNAVIAMVLSNTNNKQVTLLVDTWPADHSTGGIALYWSSSCMSFPLLYSYRSQFNPTDVQRCHAEATKLSPQQQIPRGCMIEVLTGIVQGSDGAHHLDAITAGRAVEATLNRRFANVMDFTAGRAVEATLNRRFANVMDFQQQIPRGCMIEVLTGIVQGSDGAHHLDAITAGRAVEATLNRRFANVMDFVNKPVGPFSTFALGPRELRAIHHNIPLHLRPLPAPQALHTECRSDAPELEALWLASEPLPSQYKWCRRGQSSLLNSSAAGRLHRAPTGQHALLRSFAEETTGAPHVRFLVDVAIEDPKYHVFYEDVEDLDASKVLSQHADEVNMSLDISQVTAPSPAKMHGGDASLTSLSTLKADGVPPASARPGAVTCRRTKKLVDDGTEWCELVGRRLRQALIAADEDTRFIKQVHARSSASSNALHVLPAGLVEPSGPISFTVTCKPLDANTQAALDNVINPTAWFVEGKRCPERTVYMEMLLILDVKPCHEQQASPTLLVQSVRRALEQICLTIDANRPEDLLLQVAFYVDVYQRGGPRDDTNFTASVRLAAVLTEAALRDRGPQDAFVAAKHWIRATLTQSLGRWDAQDGHEWIRCAGDDVGSTSNETDVFRVIRVFHVQRNWECGLRLVHGGRGVPQLLEAQLEKHVSWIQHLVRLVLAQGGFAGGGLGENTHSPAGSDHRGPDTSVRLLDVQSIPKFIGVQRRALVHGHQALGDDALGPGSSLNALTESELLVALRVISHQPTRPAVTMAQADALESRLLSSFVLSGSSTASSGVGVVLLTWLVPQSYLRVVQRTPPHLSDDEASSVSEVNYLVRSTCSTGLNTSDPAHPQLFVAATTSLVYDDEFVSPEQQDDDVMSLTRLLGRAVVLPGGGDEQKAAASGVGIITCDDAEVAPTSTLEGEAAEAPEAEPLVVTETAALEAQPTAEVETLPTEPAAPSSDGPSETSPAEDPTTEAPAPQDPIAIDHVTPDQPVQETEGACLRSQFKHATNPLASLFPLTPRFWEEVHEHQVTVGRLGRRCTLPAKVGLVATTWPNGVDQSGPPVVRLLTLHSA